MFDFQDKVVLVTGAGRGPVTRSVHLGQDGGNRPFFVSRFSSGAQFEGNLWKLQQIP